MKKLLSSNIFALLIAALFLALFHGIAGEIREGMALRKQRFADSLALANNYWKTGTFVDDFGDDTDSKFMKVSIKEASFQNPATIGDQLYGEVMILKDHAFLKLYEYNRSTPANMANQYVRMELRANDTNVLIHLDGRDDGTAFVKGQQFENFRAFVAENDTTIRAIIRTKLSSAQSHELSIYRFQFNAHTFFDAWAKIQ